MHKLWLKCSFQVVALEHYDIILKTNRMKKHNICLFDFEKMQVAFIKITRGW